MAAVLVKTAITGIVNGIRLSFDSLSIKNLKEYLLVKQLYMLTITETNVTVLVKNLDESIRFYESIGLILNYRRENLYTKMKTEGITLGLRPSEEKEFNSGNVSIGFMVDSITEAKIFLEMNNIPYKFTKEKQGNYLYFNDPDGTILYYFEAILK